jgi:hypothetical protein
MNFALPSLALPNPALAFFALKWHRFSALGASPYQTSLPITPISRYIPPSRLRKAHLSSPMAETNSPYPFFFSDTPLLQHADTPFASHR